MRRLERESSLERQDLVCPVCGWEITVFGDWWVDHIVMQWEEGYQGDPSEDEHSTFSPHENTIKFYNHEHPAEDFVQKRRAP